jgi:hypothetical protein
MKKILLFSLLLLSFPSFASADCVDVRGFTDMYVQGGHTLILYRGSTPVAFLSIPYCTLGPTSDIRLTKSYICDGEKIIVDGESCTILSIQSTSFPRY